MGLACSVPSVQKYKEFWCLNTIPEYKDFWEVNRSSPKIKVIRICGMDSTACHKLSKSGLTSGPSCPMSMDFFSS
jgi:hypothetical protein